MKKSIQDFHETFQRAFFPLIHFKLSLFMPLSVIKIKNVCLEIVQFKSSEHHGMTLTNQPQNTEQLFCP